MMPLNRLTRSTRVVLALGCFGAIVGTSRDAAAEKAIVNTVEADLRIDPTEKSKSKIKLQIGTMVEVTDHDPEGKWVRVKAEIPRGEETMTFEGWLPRKFVRPRARGPFSWEAGGAKEAAPAATPSAPTAAATPAASDAATTPAEGDADWADAEADSTGAAPSPAPAATKGDAAATDGDGAGATPAPADDGDGWGTDDGGDSSDGEGEDDGW